MTRSRMDRDVSQYAGLESRGESFPVSPLFAPNVNLLSAPSSIPASYTFQCPFCASHGAPTWNLIGGEVFWDVGSRENYSFDGASFRYLDLFFFARSVDEASLKRYISSSSIPYSNPKYYRGVHCIFIILLWTHSHEKNSKNFVKMLYPLSKNISKILSTIYIGIRFCNSFHKNSTKKNICATIVGNGETVREVDGDGITT